METTKSSPSEAATPNEPDAHLLKIVSTALEERRMELVRQRIVPLQREGAGGCYELIARLRDDNAAVVPKDAFVAAAERSGMTDRIDRWLFENALRSLREEDKERDEQALCFFKPFIRSLVDEAFGQFVLQNLHEGGVNPGGLCVEIGEADVETGYAQTERFLWPLRKLGCHIAVDDIGNRHLQYLNFFPADFVKIDGRIVERMHDPIQRDLVRALNQIGHLCHKSTIAKGADSPALVDMLREMKVDYAEASVI